MHGETVSDLYIVVPMSSSNVYESIDTEDKNSTRSVKKISVVRRGTSVGRVPTTTGTTPNLGGLTRLQPVSTRSLRYQQNSGFRVP